MQISGLLASVGSFTGPIVPTAVQTCAGSFTGLSGVFTGIIGFAIYLAIIIAVLMLAYGGFLWVLNPINPENRSAARNILINSAIGLVLTLAAWLIVNTVLIALGYSGGITGATSSLFSTSGSSNNTNGCLTQTTQQQIASGGTTSSTTSTTGTTTPGANNAPNTRGDCTPSGLESDGMSSNIANTMSCITKTEDTSCAVGAKSGTDIGSDGNSVSIGIFQVNVSANNLSQYSACEAAVGGQPLNCTQAFAGGAYTASNHSTHVVNQRLYATCVSAASNPQCNIQAAQDLYQNHGGSRNWGTAAQNNCGG